LLPEVLSVPPLFELLCCRLSRGPRYRDDSGVPVDRANPLIELSRRLPALGARSACPVLGRRGRASARPALLKPRTPHRACLRGMYAPTELTCSTERGLIASCSGPTPQSGHSSSSFGSRPPGGIIASERTCSALSSEWPRPNALCDSATRVLRSSGTPSRSVAS
jgi:hypothetical protein